jgi:hypothetical protein
MLFAPSEESAFWKTQWSGSLCYALSRNMNIVMPYDIAKVYRLEKTMTTYKDDKDINEIFSVPLKHNKEEIMKWRHSNYTRNDTVMRLVLNNENVVDDNIFEYIYEDGRTIKNDVLYINSGKGYDISWLLKKYETCNVKSCEEVLEIAKTQKEKMVIYDFVDRINIYNNRIGLNVRGGDIRIDDLDLKTTETVIIKNEDLQRQMEILKSGLSFIRNKNPDIIMINDDEDFIKKENIDMIRNSLLLNYEYIVKKVIRGSMENYVVYWFR